MSRLVLALSLAGLAAGCSSGNVRLAGSPLFAASNSSEPNSLAPIESSDLPPATIAPGKRISTTDSLKAKGYTLENAPIVEVGPADTAASLSTGFGLPVEVILEANGMTSPAQIRPGQRLVIPVKVLETQPTTTQTAALALNADATADDASLAAQGGTGAPPTTLNEQAAEGRHVVKTGETLWSISSANGVTPEAVRELNGLPADGTVKVGQTLRIPAPSGAAQKAPTQVASIAPSTATDAMPETSAPAAASAGDSTPSAPKASAPAEPTQQPAATTGSGFRWPVQGRIIAGFGKQADGARNDGINLAVPAGTPVHAAEDGTVIYAGNELEGFGNLILVQHADEWVSAYAHNETLTVSRGDKVSRGQPIAKVGKTGSVSQPQLHFELRKKSKPVDPLPHLSGA